MAFPRRCEYGHVDQGSVSGQKYYHKLYIQMVSLQYGYEYVFSDFLFLKIPFYILYNDVVSLLCEFRGVGRGGPSGRNIFHMLHTRKVYLPYIWYGLRYVSWGCFCQRNSDNTLYIQMVSHRNGFGGHVYLGNIYIETASHKLCIEKASLLCEWWDVY